MFSLHPHAGVFMVGLLVRAELLAVIIRQKNVQVPHDTRPKTSQLVLIVSFVGNLSREAKDRTGLEP